MTHTHTHTHTLTHTHTHTHTLTLTPGLRVSALTARYAHSQPAVRGVDLVAPRGQLTALLGPNGAGKSTLLKAIVGLVAHTGLVELDGQDLHALNRMQRAQRLAYVPQRSGLNAPMIVREVVALGRFAHRGPLARSTCQDRTAVQQALVDAGAAHLADRRFTELSGGEQQRTLLARALATGATALLLDEPTSSQDVRQVLTLHRTLRGLADRGYAILVVLHDLSEVRRHADRAVLMQRGEVVVSGPSEHVVAASTIDQVYGVSLSEGGGLGFSLGERTGGPA